MNTIGTSSVGRRSARRIFWRYMLVVSGMMNGVEVDRHGPILWENGARGSRKVFKYLAGLGDYIKIENGGNYIKC